VSLRLELLEDRALLSAPGPVDLGGIMAVPYSHRVAGSGDATPFDGSATADPIPSQVIQAYAFNLIRSSTGTTLDGTGQTIAIVDAYDDPYRG
jgi:hypothetical protein